MATHPTTSPHSHYPMVLRKHIAFNSTGAATGLSMGAVPAGAIITAVKVLVNAAFNAASTNVLVVGTAADDDAYLAAGDCNEAAVGFTVSTAKAAKVASDTEVFVKYTESGTAATAGNADVMVEYLQDPTAYA